MSNNLPALLPGIRLPAMPTFQMFERVLRPYRADSGYLDWTVHVRPGRIIPVAHCSKILAEIEAANVPATKSIAARLAALLIGSYPSREMGNPEIFISVMTATFGSYPADVGARAAEELTRRSRWLPTRAEVCEVCDLMMEDRDYAAHVARAHLAEHEAIARRREEERQRVARRALHYAECPWLRLVDEWAPLLPVLKIFHGADGMTQRLVEEFGTEAVDGWFRQLVESDRPPPHLHALQQALDPLIVAAARGRQQEPKS